MDKSKLFEHTGLWLVAAGLVVFIILAALYFRPIMSSLGHVVLAPFNSLVTPHSNQATSTSTITSTTTVSDIPSATTTPATTTASTTTGTVVMTYPEATPIRTAVPARTYYATSEGPDLSLHVVAAAVDAVQFTVVNTGGRSVPGGWVFAATLPSSYRYTSPLQPALAPGQGFTYTMEINAPSQQTQYYNYAPYQNTLYQNPPCTVVPATQIYYGTPYPFQQSNTCVNSVPTYDYYESAYVPASTTYRHGTFTITADPTGATGDTNRANNTASVRI